MTPDQHETTELSYAVTRTTLLTKQPEAEGPVGEYYFEDMRIELLWQLNVNLVNTGNQTLIGQGQIANVLGSGLTVEVPEQYRILRADVYRNDAAVSVAPDGDRELVLRFAQWRSGEAVELVLYVEAAMITMAAEPGLTFAGRQLVDGRVVRGPARVDEQRTTSLRQGPQVRSLNTVRPYVSGYRSIQSWARTPRSGFKPPPGDLDA